jgi:hypothetical protein
MCRACSTNEGEDQRLEDIDGKARRKETTRKAKRRSVNNIEMDHREIG